MEFILALVVGVAVGVGLAHLAWALLEAVGVAMSAWFDNGEDDL